MKYFSTILFFLSFGFAATAQIAPSEDAQKGISTMADKMEVAPEPEQLASFPGGEGAWSLYLANNFRYPASAKEAKEQGTVVLSFDIEPSGKITNLKIEQSVSPALDENAAYMLYKGGKWSPALLNGEAVRSRVTLPVTYKM
jgi:periplasmic protein TonB